MSTKNKSYKKALIETESIKIFGNNHDVELLSGWYLESKYDEILLNDFDYLNDSESENKDDILESIKDNFTGFFYKGELYSLSEFLIINDPQGDLKNYDGILNFTYFNGLLVKFTGGGESIKVYYFYTK